MNDNLLREKAKEQAKEFLANEGQYRLGMVDAEKPHPLTRHLDCDFSKSTKLGVKTLFSVDVEMAKRAKEFFSEDAFAFFAEKISQTILNGGRVIFSGCGSSGRLSMRLEQSWRCAIQKAVLRYPEHSHDISSYLSSVGSIMTGGDWAVIRAVESFEDSTLLGKEQAKEWCLSSKDLLVGVTATGETTSILGTALEALEKGAEVWMLICSEPKKMVDRLDRMQAVYTHPKCRVIVLPCGPMAITGSTRMQSSTFEQLAASIALEDTFVRILKSLHLFADTASYSQLGASFFQMVSSFLEDSCLDLISVGVDLEADTYRRGALVTVYSNLSLMDVLTDTTERAPTFMTPPFCSKNMKGKPSWAFVKNPTLSTDEAWIQCFHRTPRCLSWSREKYASLGLKEDQIEKIPDLSLSSLLSFQIGNERMPEREGRENLCMWMDIDSPTECFEEISSLYGKTYVMTPVIAKIAYPSTWMDLFEHLALKMMLNVLSTGAMAKIGRITGNWMTNLSMSNKKLVDRSARIVSDVCGVSYEIALEEVFYARLLSDAKGGEDSPAKIAIQRLRGENQ